MVDALHRRGDHAIVLDHVGPGPAENPAPDPDIIAGDVSDSDVANVISATRPEAIIHAAAQASVARSIANPDRDHAINLLGTAHVDDGARKVNNCRIMLHSTVPATEGWLPKPKSLCGLAMMESTIVGDVQPDREPARIGGVFSSCISPVEVHTDPRSRAGMLLYGRFHTSGQWHACAHNGESR